MDNLGEISITLNDNFTFPDNFKKLFNDGDIDLKSIFNISLRARANELPISNHTFEMKSFSPAKIAEIKIGENITERSMENLLGSSLKEFTDSDRYETTILWNHHVLVFQLEFDDPWSVSVN